MSLIHFITFKESINIAKRIAQDNAIEPSANTIRLNQNGIKPQYTQESPKDVEETPIICIQKATDSGEVRSASRDQDFDFMVMINEDNKIATNNSNSNNNCDNDNAQNLVKVENDSSSSTCDSTSSSSQK